jgi:hypothetical protein
MPTAECRKSEIGYGISPHHGVFERVNALYGAFPRVSDSIVFHKSACFIGQCNRIISAKLARGNDRRSVEIVIANRIVGSLSGADNGRDNFVAGNRHRIALNDHSAGLRLPVGVGHSIVRNETTGDVFHQGAVQVVVGQIKVRAVLNHQARSGLRAFGGTQRTIGNRKINGIVREYRAIAALRRRERMALAIDGDIAQRFRRSALHRQAESVSGGRPGQNVASTGCNGLAAGNRRRFYGRSRSWTAAFSATAAGSRSGGAFDARLT